MNFNEIVESALGREAKQLSRLAGRSSAAVAKKVANYEAELKKLSDLKSKLQQRYRREKETRKPKIAGQISSLEMSIRDLEKQRSSAKNKALQYRSYAEPEIAKKEQPETKKLEDTINKKIEKMRQELMDYIGVRKPAEEPEIGKPSETPKSEQPTIPKADLFDAAKKQVKANGLIPDSQQNMWLNKIYKENPEMRSDPEMLVAKATETYLTSKGMSVEVGPAK